MPILRTDQVTPLWETNRWDGPLSGLCRVDGEPCYFAVVNDHSSPRWYRAYCLTAEQWQEEQDRHALFCRAVGEHCNYEGWRRRDAPLRSQAEHSAFYERYPARSAADYSGNPVVGTFRWFYP